MIKKKKDAPFLGRHKWLPLLVWPVVIILVYRNIRESNKMEGIERFGIPLMTPSQNFLVAVAIAALVVMLVVIAMIVVLVFEPTQSFFDCLNETFILKCLAGSG